MSTLNETILTPPPALGQPDFLPVLDQNYRYHVYGINDRGNQSAPRRDGDFAVINGILVRRAGRLPTNSVVASENDITIEWEYPKLPPVTTSSNPLFASVAYEVRILEGTFSLSSVNSLDSFGLIFPGNPTTAQLDLLEEEDHLEIQNQLGVYGVKTQNFPGDVIYETFVNRTLPQDPIYLNENTSSFESISVPSTALSRGKSYTVISRHVVHDRHQDVTDGFVIPGYAISQYSVFQFKVNHLPAMSNLRVNGKVNPNILGKDGVEFGFQIDDPDGPSLTLRLEVGTESGDNFSSTIWDSGIISPNSSGGPLFQALIPFGGPSLAPGFNYYWRATSNDGFSGDITTDGNATFKINSPPIVTSLKVDGSEALFGEQPTSGTTNVEISWDISDFEGSTQRAYHIILTETDGASVLVDTGVVISSAKTVTIPLLKAGGIFDVTLSVRDDLEFGRAVKASFNSNAQPLISNLLIDGKSNPGDVGSSTPTFSWDFLDGDGDTQSSFEIQVARDVDFSDIVWNTGIVSGASSSIIYGTTASPTVPPEILAHGVLYHIRVKVSDGRTSSLYKTAFMSINSVPGNPTLISPTSGCKEGTLVVQWVEATPLDPDSDTVTYSLEITSQASLNRGWELLEGPIVSGTTTFNLDLNTIPAGDNYGIRIIANDGFADSDPSVGGTSPKFCINNHPPTSPTILRPSGGDKISRILVTEWSEADPVDIDGDSVLYELQISKNASDTDPIWEDIGTFKEGSSSASLDTSSFEDGSDHMLRIRAADSAGQVGQYNMSETFSITNTLSISDFETVNGVLYLGSSDGRIFRASDAIWQVDEDWSEQRGRTNFEEFKRDNPDVQISDGKLIINPVPGSTFLLRHSDKKE